MAKGMSKEESEVAMTEVEWWEFEDENEMADAVSGDIGFIIESALEARGQALVAFPGNAELQPVFDKLAARDLRWKNVTIIPTDDRLVPVDDPRSNIANIARTFLPLGARVLPITSDAADYKLAGSAADARLKDLHWPPDLVWLGAGTDGSTAAIYAGPDMDEAIAGPSERRAVGVRPDPMPEGAAVDRVTLTVPAIRDSRTVLFTISGGDEKTVLESAIAEGASSSVPIGRLFGELKVPVDIYWLEG